MLNYEVDPQLLSAYVPRGTELDSFMGKTFISLVGFQFLRTKLFGVVRIPFHSDFDEVNLRFYVRRRADGGYRRGVVFIREIVAKRAVAHIARLAYGEKYACFSMHHAVAMNEAAVRTEYRWQGDGQCCRLYAEAPAPCSLPREGSLEQFITEHYWGYSARRPGHCLEYQVSHAQWHVWPAARSGFEGDGNAIYGHELGGVLKHQPDSAFIADGSPVLVHAGRRIV
jgi:hypothetical protein